MVASLDWVLLSYRVPREPSAPRVAIWRRLKRLGAAHLGDGLVALPADARTREQLEWVAELVHEAGGSCLLWQARLTSAIQETWLVAELVAARTAEYEHLIAAATAAGEPGGSRAVKGLRAELRRIERRDYFPTDARERARRAVQDVAADVSRGEVVSR